MNKLIPVVFFAFLFSGCIYAQQPKADSFSVVKLNAATPVKNQAMTGTCWCFSTSSLLESQYLKNNKSEIDLSEMFTVYNMYIEKARNYLLREGHAQFGEGGLGHDVIRGVANYGAMPESVFAGLGQEKQQLNHAKLIVALTTYLDSILKHKPIPEDWKAGYLKLLDEYIGTPPAEFEVNHKKYTPRSYATEVLKFKADDYVNITSFTHHPFYQPFILEVPDNFSNGSYYNIPLDEMITVVSNALSKGYTVMWDADVSNSGFMPNFGLGLYIQRTKELKTVPITADQEELDWNPSLRQQLFENLTTQDDHLMHITGIEKSKGGKTFFIVKNSWGVNGPYNGYINISEAYFAMNTISLVVPKEAIDKSLLDQLKIK
jgi:bleomycin hydrolase